MYSFKSSILKFTVLIIATFGLINCSKKSKNAAPVVQQNDQPSPNSDSYTHFDPTSYYEDSYSRIEQEYSRTQFTAIQPQFTGGLYSDSLKYTANGNDNLLKILKDSLSSQGRQKLNTNKTFARSIDFTQLVVNPLNPTNIELRFRLINANSEERAYILTGELNHKRMARLQEATNTTGIVARVQCMDAAATCHQAVVKIVAPGNNQSKRVAYVIVRSQLANLKFFATRPIRQHQNNSYLDQGYVHFYKMLRNSLLNSNHSQGARIENVVIESNAVVFGNSTASVFISTVDNNKQKTIPIHLPLVRTNDSNHLNLALDDYKQVIVLKDYSNRTDFVTLEQAQSIRLIQNNGINRFQLLVSFGAEQQNSQAVILTVSRSRMNLRDLRIAAY